MLIFSRTGRSSFRTSDRIHSTLQKAVKDGNVLEKIKAFEMQAAAAQAESAYKLSGLNHRMQTISSAAHRTLSPAVVHPVQQPISPIPIQHHHQQQQQPIRPSRVHPAQPRREVSQGPPIGHESRKGAHVLEPAHGDIILKRRTPSQRTVNDEDCSITAISSVAMTTSQGHPNRNSRHQHHHHQQQQQQHRTSLSRSRHRQEMTYDKRAPSNHEIPTHKHQQKQKRATTPSSKSNVRRRWLKGRKEPPTETPAQIKDKPEISTIKPNKTSKNKKEKSNPKKPSTSGQKSKSSSDNNRVYGVPNTDMLHEQTKVESSASPPKTKEKGESEPERDINDNTSTYIAPKEAELNLNKEGEKILVTTIQRRMSKKHHQQKVSSTDGEILSKIDDNTRFAFS
jgi:hypothetical protein